LKIDELFAVVRNKMKKKTLRIMAPKKRLSVKINDWFIGLVVIEEERKR
jgi:hypothetical protein